MLSFLCFLFEQFFFTVVLFVGLCTAMKFDVYQKVHLISKTSWQFCKFLLQFLYKWRLVYYESNLHLNMETFHILAYCLIVSSFFFFSFFFSWRGGGFKIWIYMYLLTFDVNFLVNQKLYPQHAPVEQESGKGLVI